MGSFRQMPAIQPSVTVYYYAENGESLPDDGGNYWRFAPDGKTPEVWKRKDDNL